MICCANYEVDARAVLAILFVDIAAASGCTRDGALKIIDDAWRKLVVPADKASGLIRK